MLKLREPQVFDKDAVKRTAAAADYFGSDAAFGNLYLLRHKYNTLIDIKDGFLFRYYRGHGSRSGYTFPLGKGDLSAALDLIELDAKENGRALCFCLVTDEQKAQLLSRYGGRISFTEDMGDSDYIYSAECLSKLEGKLYQKKRNHISKFTRTYGEFSLKPLSRDNFADALYVEEMWLKEGECIDDDAAAERSENDESRQAEYRCICEALDNFDALGMRGAVLYVGGLPAGMTMATEISDGVWDIHFEKVIGEYAANGGYAVINKLFAQSLSGAEFINREEDINIEGLRKAKLSYYPQTILEKHHAVVRMEDE